MALIETNGIKIEYEAIGDPGAKPLLLIIGLSLQLIHWDDDLCKKLAESGYYVIRFDNRDVGLSTKMDEAGIPDLMQIIGATMKGEVIRPPYTIEDMADDAVGLLDALGIEKAHICGMSMGGMIAQTIAVNYPQKVSSLMSIYSDMGDPEDPKGKPEVLGLLATPIPEEREASIDHFMMVQRTISGPRFPIDEEYHRWIAARAFDRAFYPQGVVRQLVAIITQKNRRPALSTLVAPTLVIHGTDDPLVPVGCGKNTAAVIPGASSMIIEGMGHDLPHGGAWPQIVDAMIEHMQKTE